MGPTFEFSATTWLHKSGSWVFLAVPEDESDEIEDLVPDLPGFGSVRVEVTIGSTTWRTSLFPDTKRGCYVLPLKKPVRTAEGFDVGDTIGVDLTVIMDLG